MIPQKLKFVEQKNEKNAEISKKNTEIKQFFGKNGQILSKTPLGPQKGPHAFFGRSPPFNNAINKRIYRLENNVSHHEKNDGYEKRYVQSSCLYYVEVRRELK